VTHKIDIRVVDFSDDSDMDRYLAMLDAYARDPMGAGRPLPDAVKLRLRADLPTRTGAHALLAERSGTDVGFASCFVGYSTFRARPLLNLHDIAVVPEARGLGIARQLLEAVEALARRLDCCKVTLEVRSDNLRAQRAYESAGFVPADCDRFLEKVLDQA
jgi:ribosomal protein S18 acetylase RimI-like enzyme